MDGIITFSWIHISGQPSMHGQEWDRKDKVARDPVSLDMAVGLDLPVEE